VIVGVDHVILASTRPQSDELRARLAGAGFRPEAFHLEFPEIGAASDSLSYASGGFVEFVVALEPARTPRVWFDDAPRVIGLGFASDAFADDIPWARAAGGWEMDEDHVLPDGSVLTIRAAGPHEHLSDFYVFVMDRPGGTLQFPARPDCPRLERLTLTGADAGRRREDLACWLRLDRSGDGLAVGGVELRFVESAEAPLRVSPRFSVPAEPGSVALSGSSIELV